MIKPSDPDAPPSASPSVSEPSRSVQTYERGSFTLPEQGDDLPLEASALKPAASGNFFEAMIESEVSATPGQQEAFASKVSGHLDADLPLLKEFQRDLLKIGLLVEAHLPIRRVSLIAVKGPEPRTLNKEPVGGKTMMRAVIAASKEVLGLWLKEGEWVLAGKMLGLLTFHEGKLERHPCPSIVHPAILDFEHRVEVRRNLWLLAYSTFSFVAILPRFEPWMPWGVRIGSKPSVEVDPQDLETADYYHRDVTMALAKAIEEEVVEVCSSALKSQLLAAVANVRKDWRPDDAVDPIPKGEQEFLLLGLIPCKAEPWTPPADSQRYPGFYAEICYGSFQSLRNKVGPSLGRTRSEAFARLREEFITFLAAEVSTR